MTFKKILASLIVLGFVSLPLTVNAGIVPCANSEHPDEPCTICHFIVGFENIIKLLRNWILIVGIVIIVVAGILYITSAGNQTMTQLAKAAIKNAVIGIVVILVAWVVVVFTLRSLAAKDSNVGVTQGANAWTFDCSSPPNVQ